MNVVCAFSQIIWKGTIILRSHREGHNLDRCRTQFKLIKDMEEKLEQMKAIVDKYR